MTKGKNERRHIQNRAWEKDRRDRLNNTFDKLAKLLPEYQPKVTFSKIDILHKTIVYIEDLRKNLRDVLSTQNASILKTQEELEQSVKALVSQNNNLVELLEKANIKVPPFVGPKLLSFIVTEHDESPNDENEKNKSNAAPFTTATTNQISQRDREKSKTNEVIQKLPQIKQGPTSGKEESPKKSVEKKQFQSQTQSQSKAPLNTLPELKEVQSFGSVDLIPVSSTLKLDPKVHEKPVKNFVEITPLINNQNEKTPSKPETPSELAQSKESSNLQDSKKSLDVSVILDKVPVTIEDISNVEKQNVKISENNVIVKIEKAKSKTRAVTKKPATKKPCDRSVPKELELNKRNAIKSSVKVPSNAIAAKTLEKNSKNANIHSIYPQTEQIKVATESVKLIDNPIVTPNELHSGEKVENLSIISKELSESISNEKDLSDELFGNFPLDQTANESNPNALSPTAAFLLSFPVVSTVSSSKPTETDNSYSEGGNLLRLEEKPNQPKEHCLFESISSILNDLNEVSDAKNIPNVDNTNTVQYPYYTSKNRSNNEHEKTHAIHDINANRNRQSQKNLNINNLLNDSKVKSNRCDSVKQSNSINKKTNETQQCAMNAMPSNTTLNDKSNAMPSKSLENIPTSTDNTSDFYVSLSTLGLPLKSSVALPSTSMNPSVGSHFNFQISSLAQPRNLIDSRPLITDTPFTFSLTKCSDTTSTANSTIKTISQQPDEQCHATMHRSNRTQKKTSPTKHLVNDRFVVPSDPPLAPLNRCNSFNPFSFDNPPILPASSSMALSNLSTVSSACSTVPFTFTLTPSFSSISASTPMLSNHDPLFSSSFDMPIMRSTNVLPKTPKKDKPFYSDKESSPSWKNTKTCSTSSAPKPSKNLVNWMTSSVNKPTQELQLDFMPQLSHCTSTEEPSAWSPNRMTMDNTNLISSSALPMLQGDLALNTMSNSATVINPPANKLEMDNKKPPIRTNSNQPQKYNTKLSNHRKPDQQSDRSGKCSKSDKNISHPFKHHHQSTSSRMNETNQLPITNNFHSVSQLLDQERQTANKNNCYIPNDGKLLSKDSNSTNSTVKSKFYSKYDLDSNNQMAENKYPPVNACNTAANSDMTNECDRDLFGGYLFGQSKRLKLNYHHSSSEFLGNQSFSTTYENPTGNEMLTPYTNYQSFDSDCNNVSASSCMNNLSNQTYSYQYTQPQSYNHQTQQQPLNSCDPIDSTNYFQAPVSLSSYKPPNFNDMSRGNSKVNTHQSFLHQSNKPTSSVSIANIDPISNSKLFPGSTATIPTTNISTQLPMNRNASACPSKTIHYPSHSNINNLPLNQAWNDSFSWMPYTNSIEKPFNNNIFNSTDTSASKSVISNNIGGNNNTIPNFNLTTIFPDYNKS